MHNELNPEQRTAYLRRAVIRDLIRDIRASRRYIAEGSYVENNKRCLAAAIADLRKIWPQRNRAILNRYGYPVVLS